MRRKKPPSDPGISQPSLRQFPPPPESGDPAPGIDAIHIRAEAERERQEWEVGHAAWLTVNGLTCGPGEFRAWYENPNRDRIPMPGVLEWQRRQLARRDLRAAALGVEPAYRDLDPVAQAVSAAAARDLRELQQAREADAERIARLESALAQAASDFSADAAERARLADHVARQEEIIQQQRADAGQRDAEIERQRAAASELKAKIARKDAEVRKLQATISRLESEIQRKDGEAGRKDAAIRELTVKARQLQEQAQDAGTPPEGPPAGHHERTATRQAARIDGLETENRYFRDRVGQLESENERLRRRLAKRVTAARRGEDRA